MKNLLIAILGVALLYAVFVALNTYIYAEKQGDDSLLSGEASIQWGF